MSRRVFMKRIEFLEEERGNIYLSSAAIRLDPGSNSVKLTKVGSLYDVGTGHYAISPVTSPASVRRWIGFQADVVHPVNADTAVRFRLHDGTSHMFWNGTAWTVVAAGSTSWNTETEVAAHIATFNAVSTLQLRVVVNLISGDGVGTPDLSGVRLAYEAELPSELDDVIYRTLVPAFATVRPTTDFVVKAVTTTTTDTIDLGAAVTREGIPFNVTGVDAAFDQDGDPGCLVDIFESYNTGTGIVTLTGAVANGTTILVRVIYQPQVAFHATDPDYIELEGCPSLALVGVQELESIQTGPGDEVVNRGASTPTSIVFPAPTRTDWRMDMVLSAPSGSDLLRLQDVVSRWIELHPLLRTAGTDEPFELLQVGRFVMDSGSGASKGVRSARGAIEVRNVYMHGAPTEGEYPVLSLHLTGDLAVTV